MCTFARNLMRSARNSDPEDLARFFTLFMQPIPKDKLEVTHREYKYQFLPSPPAYDATFQVLKAMMEDFVGKHIGVAGMYYNIFPKNNAPVLWPLRKIPRTQRPNSTRSQTASASQRRSR